MRSFAVLSFALAAGAGCSYLDGCGSVGPHGLRTGRATRRPGSRTRDPKRNDRTHRMDYRNAPTGSGPPKGIHAMTNDFLRTAAAVSGLALAAASCSHAVLVRPAPSYEAFAFEAPLPAAAAVFVDADQLFRQVRMTPDPVEGDSLCGDASFPLDAREALEVSVVGTLERLVRDIRPTAAPLDRQAMEARGLDAVLVVRADTFNVGLTSGPLFSFEAGAELTLSVSAFTRDGLQLREVVFGNAVQTQSGITCGNGSEALGAAVEVAIENAMTELGELIANSPALRDSLGGSG